MSDSGRVMGEYQHGRMRHKCAECERDRLEAFVRRLLNPEDLGHAVSAWIRDEAREALGMKRSEGAKPACLTKP